MDIDFSDRELAVMNVLWNEGSATVHEVRDQMEDPPHYTSVLSVCQRLEEEESVRHEKEGRAYRYYPIVTREDAERSALSHLMPRLFRNSPRRLIRALEGTGTLDSDAIERLEGALGEDSG